jgi:hypothetical protein
MPEATLVAGTHCVPQCPPTLLVYRLGYAEGKPVEQVTIEEDRPWTVDLESGDYSIWLDTHFEAADGFSGGVYVGFGLSVDPQGKRSVTRVHSLSESSDPDAG